MAKKKGKGAGEAAKAKAKAKGPPRRPAGLPQQVHVLRTDIVTILEVYLDQAEALLATLEARLGRNGPALDDDDAARLARRLSALQKKLKPSRGRAKDLGRVEKLLEEIEGMLDGGAPPAPAPLPPPAKPRVPRTPRRKKAARRPQR